MQQLVLQETGIRNSLDVGTLVSHGVPCLREAGLAMFMAS